MISTNNLICQIGDVLDITEDYLIHSCNHWLYCINTLICKNRYIFSPLEISEIVKICNNHKTPIVPFGTGTSLEGSAVGIKNGITISLENMNKIISTNVQDFDCRVEAFVTREQLIELVSVQNHRVSFVCGIQSSTVLVVPGIRIYHSC